MTKRCSVDGAAIRDRSSISLPQTAPSFDGVADEFIRRASSPRRLLSGWVIERDAPQNKIGARQLPSDGRSPHLCLAYALFTLVGIAGEDTVVSTVTL